MADDGANLRGRTRGRYGRGPADPLRGGMPNADGLIRTIEGQIIPRLMRVHRVAVDGTRRSPAPDGACPARRPRQDDVATLTGLLVSAGTTEALAFVDDLLDRGIGLEAVYLDLLAPAARHLGELWDQDRLDFVQVTLGVCRLQQVVHVLAPTFLGGIDPDPTRRVLLCSLPGEQHGFGLSLVGDFFRRAGWDVWEKPGATRDELLHLVRREPMEIVGLSVGCESRIGAAAAMIAALRRAARKPQLPVLVGGPAFAGRPDRVALVGADATAGDGREAAACARELLDARIVRPS